MDNGGYDELGDLRREIEKLHAKLDKQAERDAKLTHERAVLAHHVRWGGCSAEASRIVAEALGEPNAVRSLDEAMRFKINGDAAK